MSKKIFVLIIVILVCILCFLMFKKHNNEVNSHNPSVENNNEESENNKKVDEEMKNMYITINDKKLSILLVDNSSTRALIEKLKDGNLTINMQDYGSMEKVGLLGFDLPTNNENITTESGEIILYQGNSFVIYYDSNNWNFTRLGKIDNVNQLDLKEILGKGNVVITLSLN